MPSEHVPFTYQQVHKGGLVPALNAFGRAFPWIFWIALLVRITFMTLARTWHVRPYDDHFALGYEMGRIGRALATGYGYADPFRGHTGPTAWVPPIYPWILAADFRLFGVYSALSAWVVLALDCVLNALMVMTTWEIAAPFLRRRPVCSRVNRSAAYPARKPESAHWASTTPRRGDIFQPRSSRSRIAGGASK